MYNDNQQRQHALSQYQAALHPYQAAQSQYQAAQSQYQAAQSQYQEALRLYEGKDAEATKLYEHCDITQAAVSQAETEYDKACNQLHKAKANDQPYEQQRQATSEALTHLNQCRAQDKAASRKLREYDEERLKVRCTMQKAEKKSESLLQKAESLLQKAESLLQKAESLLPPPKPNALVLESALQHTAARDGLGWGFEHTALEQEKEYRKWLRAATKRALRQS